ncbi:TPA: DUF551 domain-containing protein [Klebsiella pneumoniae]|nr:DUF551 domain-containing protein [Klebsiella pneumoniae]HBW4757224.1 DUF551 domain-containing protein [Klebsiella pneumoniae]HBW6830771.1 DUF551 domain-containing protein [Klebsiella pneumoniae]
MGDVLLYRHAQPAPVVPNGLRLALSNAGIAAPESDEMLAATCEKHIQALVTWVRDRKPFQSAPVVMDDRKLRSLFDSWFASDCSFDLSPEASEEDNIAWRESYWYVWQRCRAAMLQAGNSPAHSGPRQEQSNCSPAQCSNSPAIPDGYVLVPREPTEEMNKAGWAAMNEHDAINPTYRAMIAAAPQLPGSEPATVPGKWVPVSDRMPETDGNYWGWWSESKRQGPVWFIKSELQAQFQSHEITHWMPLPADPQEVK